MAFQMINNFTFPYFLAILMSPNQIHADRPNNNARVTSTSPAYHKHYVGAPIRQSVGDAIIDWVNQFPSRSKRERDHDHVNVEE